MLPSAQSGERSVQHRCHTVAVYYLPRDDEGNGMPALPRPHASARREDRMRRSRWGQRLIALAWPGLPPLQLSPPRLVQHARDRSGASPPLRLSLRRLGGADRPAGARDGARLSGRARERRVADVAGLGHHHLRPRLSRESSSRSPPGAIGAPTQGRSVISRPSVYVALPGGLLHLLDLLRQRRARGQPGRPSS